MRSHRFAEGHKSYSSNVVVTALGCAHPVVCSCNHIYIYSNLSVKTLVRSRTLISNNFLLLLIFLGRFTSWEEGGRYIVAPHTAAYYVNLLLSIF